VSLVNRERKNKNIIKRLRIKCG